MLMLMLIGVVAADMDDSSCGLWLWLSVMLETPMLPRTRFVILKDLVRPVPVEEEWDAAALTRPASQPSGPADLRCFSYGAALSG